jgi:hypothetical protein
VASNTFARFTAIAGIALASGAILASACGGLTEVDDNSPPGLCRRAGGDWEDDGCNGMGDLCNLKGCAFAVGPGCHCNLPGFCWDGLQCVPEHQ